MTAIKATTLINRSVDQIGFLAVDFFNFGQAANFLHPLEDKAHDIDREGRWRIMQRSAVCERFVIEQNRQVIRCALKDIVTRDDNGYTCGSGILLRARIEE